MTILETIKRRFAQVATNPFNESFLWAIGDGYTTYNPESITYLEQGFLKNPIIYGVVNQISTKLASVPYSIVRGKNTVLDMPLERPNPNQNWSEFFTLAEIFLQVTGNVYVYMQRPTLGVNSGTPIALYLLPAHLTQIVVKPTMSITDTEDPVDSYIMTYGRQYIEFEADDVFHIKYANPEYGENGEHLYGLSPMRAMLKNIEATNTGLDLNIKTLKNGGAFGFIHAKNQSLTVDQAKEIKERLTEMNSNTDDLSKIAGISAELGFTRLSLTADELKPFDYFQFDKEVIYNAFNWALDSGSRGDFGGTIAQVRKMRITDKILPDIKLFEQAFNTYFLPLFKGYEDSSIIFDVNSLPEMQVDTAEMVGWLSIALDRGVISKNEFRTAINFDESTDPNMDIITVASDILTLNEAVEETFTRDNESQQI